MTSKEHVLQFVDEAEGKRKKGDPQETRIIIREEKLWPLNTVL